jgi:beta-lactamase class A
MTTPFSYHFTFLLFAALSTTAFGQLEGARSKIDSIAHRIHGIVGAAIIDLDNGDTLSLRGDYHHPMQSVYKFPLALAVLDRVDKGTMRLSASVHIAKGDLLPNTWSPLRERYPLGDVDLPLDSLLRYTVSQSDNNGCDILFRLLGGTGVVDEFVHTHGITDMSIVATEEEMHKEWNVQYSNWSTPRAMARLLQLFHSGKVLSRQTTDYLWEVMAGTTTAPGRLKGLLPAGTIVAHKTGSSGVNGKGITAATNDVGIIALPNNRYIAIVVFISDSDASDESRDNVIASIARAVWDTLASR